MKRFTIRLLDSDGSFLRNISAREAEELEAKGDADRIGVRAPKSKKKKWRKPVHSVGMTYKLKPIYVGRRSIDEASPPSITRADMHANVGITLGLGEADRNRIRAAKRKIKHFHPHRTSMMVEEMPLYFTHLVNDGMVLHDVKNRRLYARDQKNARKLLTALAALRKRNAPKLLDQDLLHDQGILFDEVR